MILGTNLCRLISSKTINEERVTYIHWSVQWLILGYGPSHCEILNFWNKYKRVGRHLEDMVSIAFAFRPIPLRCHRHRHQIATRTVTLEPRECDKIRSPRERWPLQSPLSRLQLFFVQLCPIDNEELVMVALRTSISHDSPGQIHTRTRPCHS